MASIYRKQLENKRKNYVERMIKRGVQNSRAEAMASSIYDRSVPTSVHEDIIKTPLTTPAYVFSTDASYTSFKDFADVKAAEAMTSVKTSIENFYSKNPDIEKRIKQIENKEKDLAFKLCEVYGFPITGDPRSVFKREFQEFMKGTNTNIDPDIQALIEVNSETIAFDMVRDAFLEQIQTEQYTGSKKNTTQATNIIQRNAQASGNRDAARRLIENSDIGNASTLYQRAQQAHELSKKYNNAMGFISTGKGVIQEIRVAELMRYFLTQKDGIYGQVNNIIVNPIGNKDAENQIADKVATSLMGAIQKGISTSGGSDKLTTTDIGVDVPTEKDLLSLKIDVKTSNTNKYVKHSFKFTVPELAASWPLFKTDLFNLGIMAIVNNANVIKRTSKYTGLDKAVRPLIGAVLANQRFMDSYIPTLATIEDKDFQNIIVLNDKLFWYSELVRSIPENVLNTATGKGKNSFYDFTMMLDDYQPLTSVVSTQSHKLLQLKRKVLRRKMVKSKDSYEGRQPFLLADKDIQKILQQYRNAANSLSFNVALKFDIYDIL